MISTSEIMRKVRREIGDKMFSMLTEDFFSEIIFEDSLPTFSSFYPKFCTVELTANDIIPYTDGNTKRNSVTYYRLPKFPEHSGVDLSINNGPLGNNGVVYIDIADYYIQGNDMNDVYNGGNMLVSGMISQALSAMPHTRSYYTPVFQEPDIIMVTPGMMCHRNFKVQMKCEHTLATIPRNMREPILKLIVCDIKIAIYNKFKYSTGTQIYGGMEIDTKIDDFRDAISERENLIQLFEKDWILNPAQFEFAHVYSVR